METVVAQLRALSRQELITKYRETYGREPRQTNRDWLWRRLAWREQEERLGGMSNVAKAQLEALIAKIQLPEIETQRSVTGRRIPPKNRKGLRVGSTIERTFKGTKIAVTVTKAGFEWEGASYKSLSAVAFAVTGSHWNGKLFFNLTKRSYQEKSR
jgi:hypothetical protein